MALKDTLVRLKRRQEDAAAFEAEKPRLRDEWVQAVSAFIGEFKAFMAPFEAEGTLAIQDRTISLTEDDLGTYSVAAATIEASSARINLTPVGRIVVGATGRVDLSRQGHPGEATRILVLRHFDEDNGNSQWLFRAPKGWDSPGSFAYGSQWMPSRYDLLPFDKDNTERMIDFLLSLGDV